MTNNIYPPDHLLRKWEELIIDDEENVDVVLYEAFQAGADKELEACCKLLELSDSNARDFLYSARRPKPPSLKEQALEQLSGIETCFRASYGGDLITDTIRRALESLPD